MLSLRFGPLRSSLAGILAEEFGAARSLSVDNCVLPSPAQPLWVASRVIREPSQMLDAARTPEGGPERGGVCPTCRGTGKQSGNSCPNCSGSGNKKG